MNSLFSLLREQVLEIWKQVRGGDDAGYLPLLRPVAPYAGPPLLSPLATLGALFALVISSGIAVAALGVFLLALLALYLLFTEVLGLTIEVKPFPFPG
ncbi:MAG: hypothetical protein ACREQQ_02990 [Candidatus Binatia bacterium]